MRYLFILLFLFCSSSVWAQAKTETVITVPHQDARFEVLQSEISVKNTLLLDKLNGDSWVMTLFKSDDAEITAWKPIKRENVETKLDTTKNINYQIFTSGITIRDTFLINTNSGHTWRLVQSKNQDLYWENLLTID